MNQEAVQDGAKAPSPEDVGAQLALEPGFSLEGPTTYTFEVCEPRQVGEGMGSFITYIVRSTGEAGSFSVTRRFSDFSWLHDELMRVYPGCIIMELPPKTLKWTNNILEDAFVHKRARGLHAFLDGLAKHAELRASSHFETFLQADTQELAEAKARSRAALEADALNKGTGQGVVGSTLGRWWDKAAQLVADAAGSPAAAGDGGAATAGGASPRMHASASFDASLGANAGAGAGAGVGAGSPRPASAAAGDNADALAAAVATGASATAGDAQDGAGGLSETQAANAQQCQELAFFIHSLTAAVKQLHERAAAVPQGGLVLAGPLAGLGKVTTALGAMEGGALGKALGASHIEQFFSQRARSLAELLAGFVDDVARFNLIVSAAGAALTTRAREAGALAEARKLRERLRARQAAGELVEPELDRADMGLMQQESRYAKVQARALRDTKAFRAQYRPELRRLFVEMLRLERTALEEQQQLVSSVLGAVEEAGAADATDGAGGELPPSQASASDPALQL